MLPGNGTKGLLAFISIIILIIPGPVMAASDSLKETPTEFQQGTPFNLEADSDWLAINGTDAIHGEWTEMSCGTPPYGGQVVYDGADDLLVLVSANAVWTYDFTSEKWTRRPGLPLNYEEFWTMQYDAGAGLIVLLRSSFQARLSETWTYDVKNDRWANMSPSQSPPGHIASDTVSMVYDQSDERMILFESSRRADNVWVSETWSYDLEMNTWTNVTSGKEPFGTLLTAYDSADDVVVLYDSSNISWDEYIGRTWVYDPHEKTWTEKKPANSPPPMMGDSAQMVFDPVTSKVIMHGYNLPYYGGRFNTWIYDLEKNAWTNTSSPSYPSDGRMIYNAARKSIFLLDEGYRYMPFLGEIWSFDSGAGKWMSHGLSPACPPHHCGSTLIRDPATGKFMLFGPCGTWSYDPALNMWTCMEPGCPADIGASTFAPPPRIVYDGAHGVFLRISAVSGSGQNEAEQRPQKTETSTFDTGTGKWTGVACTICPPDAGPLAYDSLHDVTVLYTGGETWTFNLSNARWTNMSPQEAPSSTLSKASMAYDRTFGEVVLCGIRFDEHPNDTFETWTYNLGSNEWRKTGSSSGPPSGGQGQHFFSCSVVYDDAIGRMVLFRGSSNATGCFHSFDTYDRQLNEWTKIQMYSSPPVREEPSIACDESSGNIILFGGDLPFDINKVYSALFSDTWVLTFRTGATGTYVSAPLDAGGRADFGAFEWNATVPSGTSVGFQLRTADKTIDIENRPFIGPDGTKGTFYDTSGMQINGVHNGSRWIQYKAVLRSDDPSVSPHLRGVTINYDKIIPPPERPRCTITSPANNSKVSGRVQITGTALNGSLPLTVVRVRIDNGPWQTAIGLGNWSLSLDLSNMPNGRHTVEARAFDGSIYSDTASIQLTVQRPDSDVTTEPFPYYMPVILLVIVLGLGIYIISRKRSK